MFDVKIFKMRIVQTGDVLVNKTVIPGIVIETKSSRPHNVTNVESILITLVLRLAIWKMTQNASNHKMTNSWSHVTWEQITVRLLS